MGSNSHHAQLDTAVVTAYEVPLSTVVSWPPGSYLHPHTRHWFIPYATALQGLSTVVIAARLWMRFGKRTSSLGADDILIVVAWGFASSAFGMSVYGILDAGLDRHFWDVLPSLAGKGGLATWLTEILFLCSLCCTKISVLLFFRRLGSKSYCGTLSWAINGGILFIIAYWLAFFFFFVFACDPVEAAWKSMNVTWPVRYKCVSKKIADPLNGILSVFTDIYAIAITVVILSQLSLPRGRKAILYIVFGCGLSVVGAAAVRTTYIWKMYTDERRDLTWISYSVLIWSTLEAQMALICASALAMKGFFLSTRSSSGSNSVAEPMARPYADSTNTQDDAPPSFYNLTPLSRSYAAMEKWNEKVSGSPGLQWHGAAVDPSLLCPPPSYYASSGMRKTEIRTMASMDDFVNMDVDGIHVEQRWSVRSFNQQESERRSRAMY